MAASVVEKVRQDRGCHWMICCENDVYLENTGKISGNMQKFPWIPWFSHPFPVKKKQVTAAEEALSACQDAEPWHFMGDGLDFAS